MPKLPELSPRLSFAVAFFLGAFFLSNNTLAQSCGCKVTIPAQAAYYYYNGSSLQPGDVICIAAGAHGGIQFQNLNGSAANPIVIKNCGGQALVGSLSTNNSMLFLSSHYVKVTGTGDPNVNYGISIVASASGTQGLAVVALSSDFEIDHMEIANSGYAGMMLKSDPSSNCADLSACRPAYTLTNVKIHDCYVHNTGGEGIYLGDSFYTGTTVFCGSMQYCHEVRGVRIYNNRFEFTGREAIQVGSGTDDVEIYNNKVYNYGQAALPTQNGGIQMGVGTAGRLYNNFIKGGVGPAIAVQGIGGDYVYNNVVVSPGEHAVTINTRPTPLPGDIVPGPNGWLGGVYILNNTFVNVGAKGVIEEFVNGAPGNRMFNNLIVNSATVWDKTYTTTDWQKGNNIVVPVLADAKFVNPAIDDYRILPGSPAVNTGRDVASFGVTFDAANNARPGGAAFDAGAYEISGNQKPSVSVGANQTFSTPTTTTSISGNASDPDGSIASVLWTKVSGPAATLNNQTTNNVSISGLVPGIYTFRYSATDDLGGTDYKDVLVTVINSAINQPPVSDPGITQTITLPTSSIVINGAGTDPDGTVVSYVWTKVTSWLSSTLVNASTATLTVNGMVAGTHMFRLTVTDDDGSTDAKEVNIIVNPTGANNPPTANAGTDKIIALPTNSVNLVGSGADPGGSVASYVWTKTSGGVANIVTPNNATTTVNGLAAGTYTFRLGVTDNKGATGFDDVTVIVSGSNNAPTAEAGPPKTVQLPTPSTTLSGSGSDIDGSIASYAWSKVSGPASGTLTNAGTAVLSLSDLVAGSYVFRLTVTDNLGSTGSDETTVTVQAANVAPTANAGSAITLILPNNTTNVVGSGTDPDGSIALYAWVKQAGPNVTMDNANTSTLALSALVEGTYTFKLTVTDNLGATGSATVNVIVFPNTTNKVPVVEVGNNYAITFPASSTNITATASDEDGTIASYLWEKVSGPTATLAGGTTQTLAMTNMVVGSYLIRVTVTDDDGATASDELTVTVTGSNQLPSVSAGSNQVVVLPTASANLAATASDPDGTIASYTWSIVNGPNLPTMTGTLTPNLSASGLVAGVYIFRCTVGDNVGGTAYSDANVTVQTATNISPIADAGSPVTIFLPTNTVNLSGNATDADGTIASYSWLQLIGPVVSLVNDDKPTLTVNGLVAGNYSFRLTATDDEGAIGIDDVNVIVNPASTNQVPIANAGPLISLSLPVNSTNLIGSGTDIDGTIAAYVWTKVSGPSVTMTNQNTAVLSLTALEEGIYTFSLLVTDNNGASASATTKVTVLPSSVNQTPNVTAGTTKTITLPTNTLNLNAIATDADGSIASYQWAKQIGPTATIAGETTATLTLTGLIEGQYVFRVTVNDDDGASAFDEVTVNVLPVGSNVPPSVNAGFDKVLFQPASAVNLSGSASDIDGSIASYSWVKISGPAATLANEATATLSLSGLVAGQYTFKLTATDDDGATGFDEASVTVFPGTVNQSPVANAGSNKTIVAPATTTTLTGSGFDPDGSIAAYSWTQKSGPSATIDNINSPTLLVDGLVEGVFVFQLTVTDDKGATGSDLATITVVPVGTNQPPVADAGFDQSISFPATATDVQGAGSDADGTIASFDWIKKTGPASVSLAGAATSKLTASSLVAGTYTFALTVTDNDAATNSDEMHVTVMPAGVNQNPIVNAGADIFIRLPETTASATATATDVDGTIATYTWTQVSGAAATTGPTSGPDLSISDLALGSYVFRMEATDNQGSSASDEVMVTVLAEGSNLPPVVLAGSAQIISLPTTSTVLLGSASDDDGSITNLAWTKESGPDGVTMDGINTTTLNLSNLVAGSYKFRLTATDNESAEAFSETNVEVQAGHTGPVVFAGADTTLLLPNNFMTLGGTATATEGFIIADYHWEQTDGPPTELVGEYPQVSLTDMLTGVYTFTLTATDNFGSSSSDDIIVTVAEGKSNPIGASIAFTPNGDLVNDTWTIKNTNMVDGCPLAIFNNLGRKVYESDQYANDWDGNATTGQKALDGDYYFVFRCADKKTYSGAFRLIR